MHFSVLTTLATLGSIAYASPEADAAIAVRPASLRPIGTRPNTDFKKLIRLNGRPPMKRDPEAAVGVPVVKPGPTFPIIKTTGRPIGGNTPPKGGPSSGTWNSRIQNIFGRDAEADAEAEAQDVIPVVFLSEEDLSEEEKRDLLEARDAEAAVGVPVVRPGVTRPTGSTLTKGGSGSGSGRFNIKNIFSRDAEAEAQDVVPVIFLSEEDLASEEEKRDLEAQEFIPVAFVA